MRDDRGTRSRVDAAVSVRGPDDFATHRRKGIPKGADVAKAAHAKFS